MPKINRDDIRVRDQDIHILLSVNDISAFFFKLGYPDQFRLHVPPEQMGFPQSLCDSIQQLELITQIDDSISTFQIYFIRLLSVTVAKTRDLVRQFRDLNGNSC
jgi:hypothetical protein